MEPSVIADYGCMLGEAPVWDPRAEVLYWIDGKKGRVFRYDPGSREHEPVFDGDVIGGLTVQADGSLLLFMEGGTIKRWDRGSVDTIIAGLSSETDSQFNDVIADPSGRVYAGSLPTERRGGRLYRIDTDGTITELFDGLQIPNGLGFSPDEETLYLVESLPSKVHAFDYDRATGELSNRRVFVERPDVPGVPDGLTVDADGHVWVAQWCGGCVIRYAPDGTEERRIDMPVATVTSLSFGGGDYTDLYVTSGDHVPEIAFRTGIAPSADETDGDGMTGELAGALFGLEPGVPGTVPCVSAIGS